MQAAVNKTVGVVIMQQLVGNGSGLDLRGERGVRGRAFV